MNPQTIVMLLKIIKEDKHGHFIKNDEEMAITLLVELYWFILKTNFVTKILILSSCGETKVHEETIPV